MKTRNCALLLLASLIASPILAQAVNWPDVAKLAPGALILVVVDGRRALCVIQKLDDKQLFCRSSPTDRHHQPPGTDLIFNRADIRAVYWGERVKSEIYDYSKGFLAFLGAFGGGTALDPTHQPAAFAGVKIGGPFALEMKYDMLKGHSGFSIEGSPVIPMFRAPAYYPFREKKFIKLYGEPGFGYRAGAGTTGGYSAAKVLVILLDDRWFDKASPYVEFSRRFPTNSPLDGDTRIEFGLIWAYCSHCGVE